MEIKLRKKRPKNYHCKCLFCSKYFKGELLDENGKYISARKREGYSQLEKKTKHLCPGHFQGFKFIIEKYTDKGDIILDPFAGTGTALVEAAKMGRKAIGVELEYGKIAEANIGPYRPDVNVLLGDSREIVEGIKAEFDLIITGPVYNNNSDRPERKNLKGKDGSFNYKKKESLAFMNDKDYFNEMTKLFHTLIEKKLNRGGYFCLIIKDPIRDKEPYLLHKYLGIQLQAWGLKPEAVYIHYHYPPTLFMNTYPKRFPKVRIPLYQTMLVFRKI